MMTSCLKILAVFISFFRSLLCAESCCISKEVGGHTYHLVEDHNKVIPDTCNDKCAYKKHGEEDKYYCFGTGSLSTKCLQKNECNGVIPIPEGPRKYCQPWDPCWPTESEVTELKNKFEGKSCLCSEDNNYCIPKFVTFGNNDETHKKRCLPYSGLENPLEFKKDKVCKEVSPRSPPNPYCEPNVYNTNASYSDPENNSPFPRIACMTPYQFLTNRNYKLEWKPVFIVVANTEEEVSEALKFAYAHNIGVAVKGTGHDFNDRNAGPADNSLLIVTTCFRKLEISTDQSIAAYELNWTEGYVTVGAGQTWGQNFWWNLENAKGVYDKAWNNNKEVVGGNCHSVGVVGWTLGGGRGWLAAVHGAGVDQVLSMTVVLANGTVLPDISFKKNPELFSALRGGGGGFAVVTEMKLKVYDMHCNEASKKNCYASYNFNWNATFDKDTSPAKMFKIAKNFFKWSHYYRSRNISSTMGFNYYPDTNRWLIGVRFRQMGDKFSVLLSELKKRVGIENDTLTVHKLNKYQTWWCYASDNNVPSCENPVDIHVPLKKGFAIDGSGHNNIFGANIAYETTQENDWLIGNFTEFWGPFCYQKNWVNGSQFCSYELVFEGDFPHIDKDTGEWFGTTDNSLSTGMKKSSFLGYVSDVRSVDGSEITFNQKIDFIHFVAAPKIYKFSDNSYFNEYEYSASPGIWQRRF